LIKADQFWRVPRMAAAVRLTPVLRDYLELAYLLCYPLVPMTFGVMYFIAPNDVARASMADRFWSPVLLGVFMCYGLLPWLPTRPPRAFLSDDAAFPMSRVRRLNHLVLRHASIQVNTFPSGHVAAALAAALAVRDVSPVTGLILGVLALSIAVAAVLGRYHYLADVILGALAAVLAFIVFR
jgi:membrane-associated phospholipid phosphatase